LYAIVGKVNCLTHGVAAAETPKPLIFIGFFFAFRQEGMAPQVLLIGASEIF
jgi:hypothetical protein